MGTRDARDDLTGATAAPGSGQIVCRHWIAGKTYRPPGTSTLMLEYTWFRPADDPEWKPTPEQAIGLAKIAALVLLKECGSLLDGCDEVRALRGSNGSGPGHHVAVADAVSYVMNSMSWIADIHRDARDFVNGVRAGLQASARQPVRVGDRVSSSAHAAAVSLGERLIAAARDCGFRFENAELPSRQVTWTLEQAFRLSESVEDNVTKRSPLIDRAEWAALIQMESASARADALRAEAVAAIRPAHPQGGTARLPVTTSLHDKQKAIFAALDRARRFMKGDELLRAADLSLNGSDKTVLSMMAANGWLTHDRRGFGRPGWWVPQGE